MRPPGGQVITPSQKFALHTNYVDMPFALCHLEPIVRGVEICLGQIRLGGVTMEPYKINFRYGQHEFKAEGPREIVERQFEEFAKRVTASAVSMEVEEPDPVSSK